MKYHLVGLVLVLVATSLISALSDRTAAVMPALDCFTTASQRSVFELGTSLRSGASSLVVGPSVPVDGVSLSLEQKESKLLIAVRNDGPRAVDLPTIGYAPSPEYLEDLKYLEVRLQLQGRHVWPRWSCGTGLLRGSARLEKGGGVTLSVDLQAVKSRYSSDLGPLQASLSIGNGLLFSNSISISEEAFEDLVGW